MNFQQWIQSHANRFPRLKAYFESDRTIAAEWQKKLGVFSYEDLMESTSQFLEVVDNDTKWPEMQLGALVRIARRIKKEREFVESAPPDSFHTSYGCLECRDTAMIRVIAVEPNRFVSFEKLDESCLVDCNVSCTCNLGEKLRKTREGKRPGPLPVYVEGRCWPYDYEYKWPDNLSMALEFFKSLEVSKRHSEFDVFQESGYGTGQDF